MLRDEKPTDNSKEQNLRYCNDVNNTNEALPALGDREGSPMELVFERLFVRHVFCYFRLRDLKIVRLVSRTFRNVATPFMFEHHWLKFADEYFTITVEEAMKYNFNFEMVKHYKFFGQQQMCFVSKFLNLESVAFFLPNELIPSFMAQLPATIKSITFSAERRYEVELDIPKSVTHLELRGNFSGPVDNLPIATTHLTLGFDFNRRIDSLISVTHLTFSNSLYHSSFDQPLECLPDSVTHLTLSNSFNQPVDSLPDSITHINFGRCFNHPVDKLPKSLIYLKFDPISVFNQKVDKLPDSIKYAFFGVRFNQPLSDLPKKITYLRLDEQYSSNVKTNSAVTHLIFQPKHSNQELSNSITHLRLTAFIPHNLSYFPDSLTHLDLKDVFFNHTVDNLPQSLKQLSLGCQFNNPLDKLPKGLTHLWIRSTLDYSLDQLPDSITHLVVTSSCNISKLPSSLYFIAVSTTSETAKLVSQLTKPDHFEVYDCFEIGTTVTNPFSW